MLRRQDRLDRVFAAKSHTTTTARTTLARHPLRRVFTDRCDCGPGGGAGGELHTFVRGGGFDVDGDGEVSFLEYREAILRGGLSTIAYREVCMHEAMRDGSRVRVRVSRNDETRCGASIEVEVAIEIAIEIEMIESMRRGTERCSSPRRFII